MNDDYKKQLYSQTNVLQSMFAAQNSIIQETLRSPLALMAQQITNQNAELTRQLLVPSQAMQEMVKQISGPSQALQEMTKQMLGPSHALKEMAKQLLGPSQALQEMAKQMPQINFPVSDAVLQFNKSIQESMRPYLEISELFQNSYSKQLAGLAKALEEDEKQTKKIADRHRELKAFLPPYFWNFSYPALKEVFLKHHKAGPLVVYHKVFKDIKHQKALIKNWSKNEYYVARLPVLRKALKAYRNRDFELVVPVLLCQIEGIVRDYFGTDDHNVVKNKIKKLFPEITHNETSFEMLSGEYIIVEIICENIFLDFNPKKNPLKKKFDYPHRHTILHGSNEDYYSTHDHSTKCIMVLDFLSSNKFLKRLFPDSFESDEE